jgi:hypothetical protein
VTLVTLRQDLHNATGMGELTSSSDSQQGAHFRRSEPMDEYSFNLQMWSQKLEDY